MNVHSAEKLIQEVKKDHKKLDTKKIFNEQSAVIGKINKSLSNKVYSNFVPNYKNLATLAQLFGDDVAAKSRVLLEEYVLKRLTSSSRILKEEKEKAVLSFWKNKKLY